MSRTQTKVVKFALWTNLFVVLAGLAIGFGLFGMAGPALMTLVISLAPALYAGILFDEFRDIQ